MAASHDQLVEWGRKGGKARAAGADMKQVGALGGKATHVRHGSVHMAATGRLGWQALVAKVGIAGAVQRLHDWKLAHPSRLERTVQQALGEMGHVEGTDYERDSQVSVSPAAYGDFVFAGPRLILEVDGARWHTNDPLHGEDRVSRDARRDQVLAAAGWRVVRLNEATVQDPAALRAALETILPVPYRFQEDTCPEGRCPRGDLPY